jgi:DNA-binding Lrp family transcriptional regulator
MNLDRTDRAILTALQQDGRLANVALAARVNLSESACLRRVRALEDAGVIDRYVALLNQSALGLPDSVFVEVSLTREQQEDLEAFENAVRKLPEIMECYLMSGEYDYLLRVVVANTADYERIHREHITRLPGVARVRSSFALRTVTKHTDLPLSLTE